MCFNTMLQWTHPKPNLCNAGKNSKKPKSCILGSVSKLNVKVHEQAIPLIYIALLTTATELTKVLYNNLKNNTGQRSSATSSY